MYTLQFSVASLDLTYSWRHRGLHWPITPRHPHCVAVRSTKKYTGIFQTSGYYSDYSPSPQSVVSPSPATEQAPRVTQEETKPCTYLSSPQQPRRMCSPHTPSSVWSHCLVHWQSSRCDVSRTRSLTRNTNTAVQRGTHRPTTIHSTAQSVAASHAQHARLSNAMTVRLYFRFPRAECSATRLRSWHRHRPCSSACREFGHTAGRSFFRWLDPCPHSHSLSLSLPTMSSLSLCLQSLSLSLSLFGLSLSLSLLFACAVAYTRLHPLRAERLEFRSIEREDRWSKIGIRAERRADSANEDFDRGGGVSRERTAVMLYLCKVVSGIVPWGLFAAYRVAGQLSKHIVTHIGLITRFDFRSKCSRKKKKSTTSK